MTPEHPEELPPPGPSARAVHAGSAGTAPGAPVVHPICHTVTFFPHADAAGEVRYRAYVIADPEQALAPELP